MEFDDQATLDFDGRIKSFLGDEDLEISYLAAPKINGLAVELVYENGELKAAFAREEGYVGEDVTLNMKTILTVPLNLVSTMGPNPVPQFLEVMGVVYMERQAWVLLNKERIKKGIDFGGERPDWNNNSQSTNQ